MDNLKKFTKFGELFNLNLQKKILYPIIFFSIFLNPLLIRASDEIKSDKENNILIKYTESTNELQKDQYLLGTGDNLQLRVIGVPELNSIINILNDGTTTIPILGITNISGMTINEAKLHLEKLLSDELINPKIDLILLNARPIKISIIGEVIRPGIYKLPMNTNDLPSLINAIEKAGGVTSKADLMSIELKRRLPGQTIRFKKTSLNFKDLLSKGEQQNNPYLFDGDVITINVAKKIDKEIISLASSSLSPETIRVNFLGEVRSPGVKKLASNSTLIEGILSAGGFNNTRANYKFVEILRINRNGNAFKKRYKISLGSNYSEKNNPILNNGDSVWVKKNKFAKMTDSIGLVAAPLKDIVTIWTFFRLTD